MKEEDEKETQEKEMKHQKTFGMDLLRFHRLPSGLDKDRWRELIPWAYPPTPFAPSLHQFGFVCTSCEKLLQCRSAKDAGEVF